jgi:pilus assembly protein CpaD
MSLSSSRARLGLTLAACVGVTLLTSCAEPLSYDYTQRYPIGVQPETVTVPAPVAAGESLDAVAQSYLERGHGPITIAARAPAPAQTRATATRVEQMRQALVAAGVPASAIRTQLTSAGDPDSLTLSYERYSALLPACGDWSASMDFNPLNTDYPALGCAPPHNPGMMVADPADLASIRHADNSDTPNVERVMRIYRGPPSNAASGALPAATETVKNALQGAADLNAASGSTVGTSTTGGSSH